MEAALEASWSLINPARNPRIAAARDNYEKAKNQYLIGLRDLRLQVSKQYFDLQQSDVQVRIGQESVRSSQVSLRDARARFQAGTHALSLDADSLKIQAPRLLIAETRMSRSSICRKQLGQLK